MFEYCGWFCIAVAPHEVEDEDQKLHQIATQARNYVELSFPKHHIAEFKPINGKYMGSFAGFSNHRGALARTVIELFQKIAQKAPGSYGLLYIWDDEDPELNNQFQVGRLARGEFKFVSDHYLSPRIPTIEDPWE